MLRSSDILVDKTHLYRLAATFFLGFIIAGFLAWFMYALIQSGEQRLDESKRAQLLEFVRMKRPENTQRKERKPERPKVDKAPPAPSAAENNNAQNDFDNALNVSDFSGMSDSMDLTGGMGFGTGDGEYLPIVKVAPVYPHSARTRGTEGTCVVEYTVTKQGTTKDIFVVEELCEEKVFRKPSINAAEKFRYKPRVMNGEAVEVPRVRNQFIYKLEAEN